MKLKTFKKGQGTLEYAIIIVVVVGALIAMQWYIKGGYQGKLRQASDDMGQQFSPTRMSANMTTIHGSSTNEVISGGSYATNAMPSTTTVYNQNQTRVGSEDVQGLTPIPTDQR
jgi:uncharacterized protein (UPF0333 family)